MKDAYLNSLLGDNEQIILVTRQHWFVVIGEILSETVLTIATIVLITLIWVLLNRPVVAVGYLLLIFPLVSLLRDVLTWANHKYIVTNRRVMQIAGIFNKNVTDSSLEKVNDVKMEQSVLGRLFDYGDVEILTASELGVNLFRRIGSPVRLKTVMLNAKEMLEKEHAGPGRRAEPDVPALIAQLDALRQHGVLTEAEFQQKKAELLAKM